MRITETAPLSVSVHPRVDEGFHVDQSSRFYACRRDGDKCLGAILPFVKISCSLIKKKRKKKETRVEKLGSRRIGITRERRIVRTRPSLEFTRKPTFRYNSPPIV